MTDRERDLASLLRQAGVARGDLVGLAVTANGTIAVATPADATPADRTATVATRADATGADRTATVATGTDVAGVVATPDEVAAVDVDLRPRWVTWSGETSARLTALGVRLATCWDVAAVHRLLSGGWPAQPGLAWASLHGLATANVPSLRPGELLAADGPAAGADTDTPLGPGGYLRLEWTEGGWADSPARLIRWARLAVEAAVLQQAALAEAAAGDRRAAGRRLGTARSESTVELLCAELAADGLPVDRAVAERLLGQIIGPRPRDAAQAARIRADRDQRVLRHAPEGRAADLRSPGQVKALLAAAGIDVPDTRAWRLEPFKDTHPLVAALLEWRKAERIATTYGYAWLDSCLGPDGRLRGQWTSSDGAAGRMTASDGLHNMPAVLRQAVIAADGHVFIRADLGQIEPRVLAAVSADAALVAATQADDLYLPVARQLSVDRPTAKVAMIAAMYGQTTGHGGQALRRMKAAYPVAMAYLDDAEEQARSGRDLRTYGGRLVRMSGGSLAADAQEPSARVAGRGRYGRNAMIQGAAAEMFKMWAATVRARGAELGADIVLCLHDELLVHVAERDAEQAARLVGECLEETARRWAPAGQVRFLADISAVRCWADAKPIARADTVTASIGA
ncbi:MAG TPA: DNA polymerase [Trebonia sp.]|nr:DNA polymerase [Trebonia sp.]